MNNKTVEKKLEQAKAIILQNPKRARAILYHISIWHGTKWQQGHRKYLLEKIKWIKKYGSDWETEWNKLLIDMMKKLDHTEFAPWEVYPGDKYDGVYAISYDWQKDVFYAHKGERKFQLEIDMVLETALDIYIDAKSIRRHKGDIVYFEFGGDYEKYNSPYESTEYGGGYDPISNIERN